MAKVWRESRVAILAADMVEEAELVQPHQALLEPQRRSRFSRWPTVRSRCGRPSRLVPVSYRRACFAHSAPCLRAAP